MKFMKLKKFAQKTISLLCAAAVTCSIVPVFAEGEKETDNMHITEKTYTFYADTINSDGSLGRNEWGVTSVPQFFYVDTVRDMRMAMPKCLCIHTIMAISRFRRRSFKA